MKLDKLFIALKKVLELFIDNGHVINFLLQACDFLLNNKFVVSDTFGTRAEDLIILHKCESLSIGEYIATACSSIYRYYWFDLPLLQWRPAVGTFDLLLYRAYIDDTFGIIVTTQDIFDQFIKAIKGFESSIEITLVSSLTSVDYLDLSISIDNSVFNTVTYKKPTFQPQYIPVWSYHRPSSISGIYKTEATRYQLNTNLNADFVTNINLLQSNLWKRGFTEFDELYSFLIQRRELLILRG